MPIFTTRRTIQVQAGIDSILPFIHDFKQWITWSPWLLAEPECEVTHAADGRSYEWKGKVVGSGKMEMLKETEGERIDYRLTFLEPWKSVNSTSFIFKPVNGGTEISWTMEGPLPWFMFWMKKMMSNWIGMDYDRGLRMLKDLAESGQIPSALRFVGKDTIPAIKYFGIRRKSAMAEVGEDMTATFQRLEAFMKENALQCAAPPRSMYHKWAMSKGTTDYTVACPIESLPANLPADFVSGEMPEHTAYIIEHTGAYRHLGNAWAAGMMHERGKVFAQNKKMPPFEIYDSDPKEVPETELLTRVCFPVNP